MILIEQLKKKIRNYQKHKDFLKANKCHSATISAKLSAYEEIYNMITEG